MSPSSRAATSWPRGPTQTRSRRERYRDCRSDRLVAARHDWFPLWSLTEWLRPMKEGSVIRIRLRRVVVLVTMIWIGLGPIVASSSFWQAGLECCCGGGSACLLFGCECGGHEPTGDGENGGIRSSPCQTEDATASFFSRHLGLTMDELGSRTIQPTGQTACGDDSLPEFPSSSPDSPPPRCADAHRA